ncbi:MAG: hypothetical protein ACI9CA_000481 [Natronomonas sp.]|jgi:hypothetical protein
MGFGSYDESEQENQELSTGDEEGVTVEENAHSGDVAFESDASTDELVDQLQDMKDDEDEEEE